jgi:hypothetical protein
MATVMMVISKIMCSMEWANSSHPMVSTLGSSKMAKSGVMVNFDGMMDHSMRVIMQMT